MTAGGSAILGFAGITFGLAAMAATGVMIREIRRWQARCAAVEAALAGMRCELELAASIAERTGRQVGLLQHECADLAERIECAKGAGADRSLDQAIEYARRGADSVKLAARFGLSRGEADLVARLHGRRRSA